MSPFADLQVNVVSPADQVAALWLLCSPAPAAMRRERVASLIRAAGALSVDFAFLLEARRGSQRLGVVWGQCLPGRTANIWPPRLEPGSEPEVADRLQTEVDHRVQEAGMVLAQALLPVDEKPQAECLARHDYAHVAHLLYLLSQLEHFPSSDPAQFLQFIPCTDVDAVFLQQVIEKTYIDSQDAPSLDGLRTLEDVLEGYRGTGRFDPRRWFLVRRECEDVGCLLLTDHPGPRHCELIYMGLIPSARGKGWGREIVRYAQWQTRLAARDLLVVSVDSTNNPAISVYSRCGFSELDRREVWIKNLGVSS